MSLYPCRWCRASIVYKPFMVFEWMTVTQDSDSGTDRSVQLEYQAVITGEAAVCAALNSDCARLGRQGTNDSIWRRALKKVLTLSTYQTRSG